MVPTAIVNAFRGGILAVIDEGVNRIVLRFDHLFASVSIAVSVATKFFLFYQFIFKTFAVIAYLSVTSFAGYDRFDPLAISFTY